MFSNSPKSHPWRLGKPADKPIVVTPLKYSQVPKARRSLADAFVDDPLIRYMGETPDRTAGRIKLQKFLDDLNMYAFLTVCIHNGIANTVDKGSSVAFCSYAKNSPEGKGKTLVDVFLDNLLHLVKQLEGKAGTRQQKERKKEFWMKQCVAFRSTIKDQMKDDMLFIGGLFTSPESQGRGYASAVLGSITDMADSESRPIWLVSSNIHNTEFYNSNGFFAVASYIMGDNNPDWHEPPFLVSVMVREPRKAAAYNDGKAASLV